MDLSKREAAAAEGLRPTATEWTATPPGSRHAQSPNPQLAGQHSPHPPQQHGRGGYMPPNAFGGAAHAPGYNGCGYPPYTPGPLGLWREPGFGPPGNSHFQQELVNARMTLQMQRLSPTPMMLSLIHI